MDKSLVTEPQHPLVYLNVGGIKYVTLRSTLLNPTYAPNFLAQLIENDLSNKLSAIRDQDNHIFIDRNGLVFAVVLDYLRTGELNIPATMCRRQVELELDYFGLVDIAPVKRLNAIVDSWKQRAKGT